MGCWRKWIPYLGRILSSLPTVNAHCVEILSNITVNISGSLTNKKSFSVGSKFNWSTADGILEGSACSQITQRYVIMLPNMLHKQMRQVYHIGYSSKVNIYNNSGVAHSVWRVRREQKTPRFLTLQLTEWARFKGLLVPKDFWVVYDIMRSATMKLYSGKSDCLVWPEHLAFYGKPAKPL